LQEGFLRYWVKYDPEGGLAALDKAMRLREHTRCFATALGKVLAPYYSPVAEKLAMSFLDDPELDVVADAANLLARKGSAAAVDALLARLPGLDSQGITPPPGASYSEGLLFSSIADILIEHRREPLTEEQRAKLQSILEDSLSKARLRTQSAK
jgi:hypothetical protein